MTKRVTVKTIREMKQAGEKIVSLTAYDASFARVIDEQGVDVIHWEWLCKGMNPPYQ